MDNSFLSISYVFGALLVVVYAYSDFNKPVSVFKEEEGDGHNYGMRAKPSLPKYMTDRSKFFMVSILFILAAVMEYYVVAKLLPIMPGINNLLETEGKNKALVDAGMPIVSALLLLGLVKFSELPRKVNKYNLIRLEQYFDIPRKVLFDFIKRELHDYARIPEMWRSIFESLCYELLNIESEVTKKNIERLLNKKYTDDAVRRDLIESDFRVGNSRNLIWKWARLSYAINIVEDWNEKPLFNSQLKETSLGWTPLRRAYIDIIDDVITHREGLLDDEQQINLSNKIEDMLANCHKLMACVVIMVAKKTEDPLVYIQEAGYLVIPGNRFTVPRNETFRVMSTMIPAIVLISLAINIISLVGGSLEAGDFIRNVLTYVLSAIIILVLPIVFILALKRDLSMKRTWPMVTRNNHYNSIFDMPLGIYSLISLGTWLLSTILMMVVNHPDKLNNIVDWKRLSVFCFISAMTAFITAYRVDIPPIVYSKRKLLYIGRLRGALIQGMLTAVIVWAGLVMFPAEVISGAIWKFPLMGFVVAVVLNITLFYGKHTYERRRILRNYVKESIKAVIKGQAEDATLLSKSDGGASVKLNRSRSLPMGTEIELLIDDLRFCGQVVGADANELSIAYS